MLKRQFPSGSRKLRANIPNGLQSAWGNCRPGDLACEPAESTERLNGSNRLI
jgi:hypothetical protein